MSPLAKEMMISDFHDRYAEGMPGKRYYRGNIYVDKVEIRCMELAQRIFKCKFADVRPISGTVANMAALFALTEPGDTITTASLDNGAHISTAKFGATGFRGINTVTYPFDVKDMVIDIDGAKKVFMQTRPKVAQFGMSLFLFPIPLKELRETFKRSAAPSGMTPPMFSDSSPAASSRTPCTRAPTWCPLPPTRPSPAPTTASCWPIT